MVSSRHNGPGRARIRLRETGIGFFLGLSLAMAEPASAAPGDSLNGADTLPPPQSYIAAYVADSATGLPLGGASVNIRNPQAIYTITSTDTRGWAYVAQSGLPRYGSYTNQPYWVTAGSPGYVSSMITVSACGSDAPPPCVLRYALARATAKNSLTFTGTLLDSASRQPIAGYTFDISHGSRDGWATYVSRTDDTGHFAFTGIPIGNTFGYLRMRIPQRIDEWIEVNMHDGGKPILVSRWPTTSLAPSRAPTRAVARGKSMTFVLLPSPNRDATGRRRD